MIRTSHYLFAALCLGSLFACSRQFTDSYIVPKWCFAVFMLFIVLAYEAVNILFYRQNEQKDTRISVYGFIIVISCFLQAMFGVVQFFGFFQISTTLWVTGSFDNPAGFAACLCAGFPFVGFLLSDSIDRICNCNSCDFIPIKSWHYEYCFHLFHSSEYEVLS